MDRTERFERSDRGSIPLGGSNNRSLSKGNGLFLWLDFWLHKYRSMQIHEIHDNTNKHVISLLEEEFSTIANVDVVKNYHPDYRNDPANFFYVLESGRFRKGHGKYYVIEEDNKFICSAGWNEYDLDPTIVLYLTRMYVNKAYRAMYYVGTHILPLILAETTHYERAWITSNKHNKAIYDWFERASAGKQTSLFNNWPEIYRQFKPIGKREVYYTEQYIVEYDKLHS